MMFERTKDAKLIRAIATHPKVWPTIADDLVSDPASWNPVLHDGVWYVLAKLDGEVRGMFVFFPENSVCWQVHICLLPIAWGAGAKCLREVFAWLWARTACRRITGSVPLWNEAAIHCALRAGMTAYGVNQHSSLKNARLHHQLLLGISK
jgi:RimJ/RimL family protein N-acetyltransferase